MKNGPVYSNISNINRAFRTFGSPLHFDLILDYVRTNWENGRGTPLENAKNLVTLPLNAKFYFDNSEEEDHYVRKEVRSEKLNDLYKEMKWNHIPCLFSTKTVRASMKEIYMDPRFDTISSVDGAIYIILTDWNLLNDLVYTYMFVEKKSEMHISDAYRDVISKYEIDDPNAYFFPKIDQRFIISKKSTLSLRDGQDIITEPLSIQVTEYIKENVAINLPKIRSYVKDKSEPVKLRKVIKHVFAIEPHFTLFTAYFEAVKQSIHLLKDIFIVDNDTLINLNEESIGAPEKIMVAPNSTDFNEINKKVISLTNEINGSTNNPPKTIVNEKQELTERESLTYTLRYFDRIQETLSAHYFKDWIQDGYLEVTFIGENVSSTSTYIFKFDTAQNIIYGEHLSNFMIDYDLEPGQKLEFQKTPNKLHMRLGVFDKRAHSEQMKYEDLVRLAEIKHYGAKSLMQNLAELLILHPSGMHIRQIIKDIKGETSYTESSIRNTLSSYPFFETIAGKVGYWRFNPRQWQKKYMDFPKEKGSTKKHSNGIKKEIRLLPLRLLLEKQANETKNKKMRLTNHQYQMLPKEKFIELAWNSYKYTIYHYAKNYASDMIQLEDAYQQAYFALSRAYDNYQPRKGGSFYHYFKKYLYSVLKRYLQNNRGIVRIPIHRIQELENIDSAITLNLLEGNEISLDNRDEFDFTLYKKIYLSFEELYSLYNKNIDDDVRARIYSFINLPSYIENINDRALSFNCDIEEPEECMYLFNEENFEDLIEIKVIIEGALNYLKTEVRNQRDYEVILYRFGFITGEEMTLDQVAKIYGITRERVRQIEAKSLGKLREYKGLIKYKEANA